MENEFVWTDELVNEFVNLRIHNENQFAETGMLSFLNMQKMNQFKSVKSKELSKEKDYEILSFISDYGGERDVIFNKSKEGIFYPETLKRYSGYELDYMFSQPTAKIHSVRRLSDLSIFTIGDKVKYTEWKCNYDYFIIDNFFLDKEKKCLVRNKGNTICEWVTDIEKIKERNTLFTTEQEAEIKKIIQKFLNVHYTNS